jgi:cation:H+ antiporter
MPRGHTAGGIFYFFRLGTKSQGGARTMFGLSTPQGIGSSMLALLVEFLALSAVVAAAGTALARAADAIAEATGLGRVLVGSILLATATSLPELSVDLAAVRAGHTDLAAGDLLGSSLMNLLILAGVDLCRRDGRRMLSREAASHALSATLAIALTGVIGCAILASGKLDVPVVLGISGWSWAILLAYLLGARMLFIDQRISARVAAEQSATDGLRERPSGPLGRSAAVFTVAAAVLVAAGPRLADTAARLADRSGLGGTFVGSTLVAFTTSLPELVASVAAVRLGALDLAIGNTFGSNAFNMILFAPLDAAHPGDLFRAVSPAHAVTALAVIVATAIAVLGQLYHAEKRLPLVEPDALLMLLVIGGGLALVFLLSS